MGEKRAEIYTYEAPWQIYAMNWSVSSPAPESRTREWVQPSPAAQYAAGRPALVVCRRQLLLVGVFAPQGCTAALGDPQMAGCGEIPCVWARS